LRRQRPGAARVTLVAMLFAPLIAGLAGVGGPAMAQATTAVIEAGIQRTVLLGIVIRDPQGGLKEVSGCSGSFVTPAGMILTASHCVRATDDEPRIGVRKGQLYHPDGMLTVSVHVPSQVKPVMLLLARVVADEVRLDIALLRSERLLNAGTFGPLPSSFAMPAAPLGNPEATKHGDPILLIGFPAVGGDTVTVGRGYVTGYTVDAGGRKVELKTDLGAPGFSGAPVFNERGEQIAVHTSSVVNQERAARSGRATMVTRLPAEWAAHLGGATIAQAAPATATTAAPPGATSAAATTTTALQGRVVDAATGVGIAGAGVWVLNPGAGVSQPTPRDVAAWATTDATGIFQAAPPVLRGASYPLIVAAQGFQKLSGFVDLTNRPPVAGGQVTSIGTMSLTRQP
jgi:S1-C subfamily serine protease